jgi:RNA recognition motif-containing protein
LEWIDDVQSLGSGVEGSSDADAAADEDQSAEAIEARQDAVAASEQLFLISLFRVSLCDYIAPSLWDPFLSYVTRAADSLLTKKGSWAAHDFRALAWQAIYPRGVVAELKKRRADKLAAKKQAKADAAAAAAAAAGGSSSNKSHRKKAKSTDDDRIDERSDAEDSSSGEDDDADAASSDDDDADSHADAADNLWTDEESEGDEDDEAEEDDEEKEPSVFARLHPALLPLLPLPYSRADGMSPNSALPSAVPVCYSYVHGDSIYQKLRGIEMHLLTRMMQQLQRQQENGGDDDEDPVDEDALELQIDRINRLYRVELTAPLADTEAVYASYLEWQKQQATEGVDAQLRAQYDYSLRIATTLGKKFETRWAEMETDGQLTAGIGVLTPAAHEFFTQYIDWLSQSAKSRKRCKDNPSQLWNVLERIVAIGFLEARWWLRFCQLARQFAVRGSEGSRYVLEVSQRAWRNCPWDASVAESYLHALEAQQVAEPLLVTRSAVEEAMTVVLSHPALLNNAEGAIEVRLQVVGYYWRTVLLPRSSADATDTSDVYLVRSHFESLRRLLSFAGATLAPARLSELCARVYRVWVQFESAHMFRWLGDGTHEDAQEDAEAAAHKTGVSLPIFRARQLFQQYVDDDERGSIDARPWMEWIEFELRTPTDSAASAQASFVRGLFRQAIDRLTGHASFRLESLSSLSNLAPLLQRWMDFELYHSETLTQLQHAQSRCAKYLSALRTLQAQEAQLQAAAAAQAWAAQVQEAAAVAAPAEEPAAAAPANWLSKDAPQSRAAAKAAAAKSKEANKSDKEAAIKIKGKKAAAGEHAVSVEAPAAPEAAPAAGGGKAKKGKRRRDSGAEATAAVAAAAANGAIAPAAGEAASEEPSSKSFKASASSDAATSSAAPPAHTLYLSNVPWTVREPELRALLAPHGTVLHLVVHKAVKGSKAFVEVTLASEDECVAAGQALQGKELQPGKTVVVARQNPNVATKPDAAVAAAAAAGPAFDPLSVFVKNLPRDVEDLPALVRAHFEPCGAVVGVEIALTPPSVDDPTAIPAGGKWRNSGVVRFASSESVPLALAKHLSTLQGSVIGVVPNQAPSRQRKLKEKLAAETKRKPAPSSSRLAFVPRATAIQKPDAAADSGVAAAATEAPIAPLSSNADFRKLLLQPRS